MYAGTAGLEGPEDSPKKKKDLKTPKTAFGEGIYFMFCIEAGEYYLTIIKVSILAVVPSPWNQRTSFQILHGWAGLVWSGINDVIGFLNVYYNFLNRIDLVLVSTDFISISSYSAGIDWPSLSEVAMTWS